MSDDIPLPLPFRWDGDALIPLRPKLCDRYYVVGEVYTMAPVALRSMASHNHFFAAVKEAWDNLPAEAAERFASPEHLRKFALIATGWRDERNIVCASESDAKRFATFVRPFDEFAIVIANGATVTVYTAKSQSMKAMGKADFQKSKDDVLSYLAEKLGVGRAALDENAGAAA